MKTKFTTLITMAIIMVLTLSIQAQNTTVPKVTKDNTNIVNDINPGTFVDKNNNGKCDNNEAKAATGRGRNFTDKNGDGLCDNKENAGKSCGNRNQKGGFRGQGNRNNGCCGRGPGQGNGNCRKDTAPGDLK